MASKNKKSSLIVRLIKAPFRILAGARDFYVRNLIECSGHMSMGCPTVQVVTTLPKSFSVSSSRSYASYHDEDFRELVRAASTKSLSSINKHEQPWNDLAKVPRAQVHGRSPNLMPRSFSTGIGRIDENKSCEFENDVEVRTDLYPRSRSYAVNRRPTGLP